MAYNNDTPIGTIIPFAGYYFYSGQSFEEVQQIHHDISETDYLLGKENANSLAENGWLLCDGKQYLLTTDETRPLFKICKTLSLAWGGNIIPTGNTFRLPNLQGLFLRGVAFSSLNDPEASARIKLYANDTYGQSGNQVGSFQKDQLITHSHLTVGKRRTYMARGDMAAGGVVEMGYSDTDTFGGSETRPKNVYVHYLIKAAQQSLDLQQLQEENKIIEENYR